MKAIKNIENKKFFVIFPIILVFIIFLTYIFFWYKTRKYIVDILDGYNAKYEIKYDSIRTTGFPFIINTKIKNLRIKSLNKKINNNYITIDNFFIKNLILTKKLNFVIDGNVYIGDKKDNVYIIFKNNSLDVKLDKNNKVSDLDSFFYNLEFVSDGTITKLNSVTFKVITTTDYAYENKTFRINIDQIISNDKNESNFETIFSFIKEFKNEQVVLVKSVIDTFTFNDITNNYGLSLSGEGNINAVLEQSPLKLKIQLNNYNSLIKSINDLNSKFLFGREFMSNFVQTLTLIPKNNNDTVNVKYYDLSFDFNNKNVSINNVDISDILQNILTIK